MNERFPFAEQVAESTPLVLVADPVTKELYGYTHAVVDLNATMRSFSRRFRDAHRSDYYPTRPEQEIARDIFLDRERHLEQ